MEKTSPSGCCIFYFVVQSINGGNGKSLENDYNAYNGYENMMNGYGMIFYPWCCEFIWVLALLGCWVMVYSLWFKSLCLDALWTYKKETVEDTGREHTGESSYGGYSGGSGGGYTAGDGTDGCVYTRADGLSSERYSGDGDGQGYSGDGKSDGGSSRRDDKTGGGDYQSVETIVALVDVHIQMVHLLEDKLVIVCMLDIVAKVKVIL